MRFGKSYPLRSFLLLAPPSSLHDGTFGFCQTDDFQYDSLLREAQRLRGRLYLQDGAVSTRSITNDGRLVHHQDEQSWHLLVMNDDGLIAGCARYIPYKDSVSFSELGVARSALAHSHPWGPKLRRAVEAQRAKALRRGLTFAEVGGWALTEELRYSTAALDIFLNVCALARLFGGAVAITTATFRHHSSSILRKLGGRTLVNDDGVELPSYYDPQYDCEMEVLQFDSDCPNPRYIDRIHECQRNLAGVPTICSAALTAAYAMS